MDSKKHLKKLNPSIHNLSVTAKVMKLLYNRKLFVTAQRNRHSPLKK